MRKTWLLTNFGLTLLVLSITGIGLAQPEPFSLNWWTVDSGGASSAGGSYALSGSLGQPDAGSMSGGNYQLGGGFWGEGDQAVSDDHQVFLPLISRNFDPTATQFTDGERTRYLERFGLRVGVDKEWGGAIREIWMEKTW